MPFKTVLVHVDSAKACRGRLELAASIARAGKGRLIGVYSSSHDLREVCADDESGPRLDDSQRAQSLFNKVADDAGVTAEWILPSHVDDNVIVVNGRYADLVVIGEPNPEHDHVEVPAAHPERVVLAVGRPVLVVPYIGAAPDSGKRILVAWDASTPAVRAVHDALPMLQHAERVTLLSVNPPKRDEVAAQIGERIRDSLQWHGVEARVERTLSDGGLSMADVLLDWATDHEDDLMVMGVHPGRRFGERVIDGPTRRVIEQMTLPVLMSN